MAPYRSNAASEKLLSSSSAEDISPNDNEAPSSPRMRNRYLEKVGVDSDINDDYPLLNGDN